MAAWDIGKRDAPARTEPEGSAKPARDCLQKPWGIHTASKVDFDLNNRGIRDNACRYTNKTPDVRFPALAPSGSFTECSDPATHVLS